MFSRLSRFVSLAVALAIVVLAPVVLVAQVVPDVNGVYPVASKWDIFMGYSFLSPHGTVDSSPSWNAILPASYDNVNLGGLFNASYFFNRHIGAQVEGGWHEWGVQNQNPPGYTGTQGNNDGFTTAAGGIVVREFVGRLTPFAHALAGEAMVDGPAHNLRTWGPEVTVGGGVDYATPWFHHRLAIRLAQADYEYMHVNFGANMGGTVGINAVRLSGGVVLHCDRHHPPR